jgi:hypothetical protein
MPVPRAIVMGIVRSRLTETSAAPARLSAANTRKVIEIPK